MENNAKFVATEILNQLVQGSHHRCWVDAVSVTGQFSIPLAVPVTTVITRCRHQFVQQTVLAWDI
ncbi:hypothetical protein FIL84_19690 [Escherichia coli]|nr:hypothetical protein [Escherichia coli]